MRYYQRQVARRSWRRLIIILIILGVTVFLPLQQAYFWGQSIVSSAKAVSDSAKKQNLDEIRKNLREMKKANDRMQFSLNFLIWAQPIPYFGGFYSDLRHFSLASSQELQAIIFLADSLDPYKVELGFTGQSVSSQDRVAQFVKILNKIYPQLDRVSAQLKKAAKEVESVDVNKYPKELIGRKIKSQVELLKNFIIGADYAVNSSREALEVAPIALGEPSPKNYLIIFQNDKELRPTGGFMTAYAFLKLDKGRVSSSNSDDIYRLDEKLLSVCLSKICPLSPPQAIVKYLPEATGKPRTAWSMRDSNLSPDLPSSMREFERMYELLGEGLPFDGIIMIDTHVVEELVKITGPVEVYGTKYSAEVDKRCNCPNVIYELEAYSQIIEKGEKDRKAILGTLMQQILARSLGSFNDKLLEFVNTGVKLAAAKHMMFYMHDGKTQQALSKLNWTGQIESTSSDYLHINDSNFAGGKSNLYVEEDVRVEIETKGQTIRHKLNINYKNPQAYGTWLNGINRDYVRVYVPKGSKLISSKGSEVPVTTIEDQLGKTVFEAFIQVRPQNSLTLSFEYETPKTHLGGDFPILIQKQPGTKDFKYQIKINGKKRSEFKLDSDKELKLSL